MGFVAAVEVCPSTGIGGPVKERLAEYYDIGVGSGKYIGSVVAKNPNNNKSSTL